MELVRPNGRTFSTVRNAFGDAPIFVDDVNGDGEMDLLAPALMPYLGHKEPAVVEVLGPLGSTVDLARGRRVIGPLTGSSVTAARVDDAVFVTAGMRDAYFIYGVVPEVCDDGVDNDIDGLLDCEDADCFGQCTKPCGGDCADPGCWSSAACEDVVVARVRAGRLEQWTELVGSHKITGVDARDVVGSVVVAGPLPQVCGFSVDETRAVKRDGQRTFSRAGFKVQPACGLDDAFLPTWLRPEVFDGPARGGAHARGQLWYGGYMHADRRIGYGYYTDSSWNTIDMSPGTWTVDP